MICGALQTLNEEACEDVLEETEDTQITIDPDLPQTSIIPPSPDNIQGESQSKSLLLSPQGSNKLIHNITTKKVTYNDSIIQVDFLDKSDQRRKDKDVKFGDGLIKRI